MSVTLISHKKHFFIFTSFIFLLLLQISSSLQYLIFVYMRIVRFMLNKDSDQTNILAKTSSMWGSSNDNESWRYWRLTSICNKSKIEILVINRDITFPNYGYLKNSLHLKYCITLHKYGYQTLLKYDISYESM